MKVKLTVEENIRYQSEIVVEQPDSMSDEEFEQILKEVESKYWVDSAKEFAYVLSAKFGIKVHDVSTGFPDSPDESEFEIIDVSNIEDDE